MQDDDVRLWAHGVVTWLAEQLDTGVLRWGQRITLPDGTVAIDPTLETRTVEPMVDQPGPRSRAVTCAMSVSTCDRAVPPTPRGD